MADVVMGEGFGAPQVHLRGGKHEGGKQDSYVPALPPQQKVVSVLSEVCSVCSGSGPLKLYPYRASQPAPLGK